MRLDDDDPLIGKCARCGNWWDEHPGGWCPGQIDNAGTIHVETAQTFVAPQPEREGEDDE